MLPRPDRAVLLLGVLIFLSLAHALSGDEVLTAITGTPTVGGYLNDGEAAKLLFSSPVDIGGERYWLVYTYATNQPDSKNVVFAVSDSTGQIVSEPAVLSPLFGVGYESDALTLLAKNKESLDDFDQFLADAENKRATAENNFFQVVKQQLAIKYPQLDFTDVEEGLSKVKDAQQVARGSLTTARTLKSQFDSYPTQSDFDGYFVQVNVTMGDFSSLMTAMAKYQNVLLQKTTQVANSPSLNYSDKSDITAALNKLSDVGDRSFKSSTLDPGQRSYNALAGKKDAQVNDSVQASISRYYRKQAENAYTAAIQARVETLLAPGKDASLKRCAVDATQLKSDWAKVRGAMVNPFNVSIEQLKAVPSEVSAVSLDADAIETKLAECNTAPTSQAPAPPNNSGLVNLLIVAVILLLAWLGYRKWKASQEQE